MKRKIWSAVLDLKKKPFNRKKKEFAFFFIDTDGVGVSIYCQWKQKPSLEESLKVKKKER